MKNSTLSARVDSTAIKSECGLYRYELKRVWDSERETGVFLCANPSTADHLLSDQTVLNCSNLAVQWNWGGFYVVNLYPTISTDPEKMKHDSKAEEWNTKFVKDAFAKVQKIVLACGNGHGPCLDELIKDIPTERLFCLRKNKGGGFLHPARIKVEDFPQPIRAFDQ